MRAIRYSFACAVVALGFLQAQVEGQTKLGTAFTYQGHLKEGGEPVTGAIGLSFSLFGSEADGQGVGDPILFDGSAGGLPLVQVTGGLLSVELDFGPGAFDGNARWLEVAVLTPGGDYTILSPRQPISPAPYALHVNGLAMDEAGVLHATGDIQTDGKVAASAFASNSPLVLESPENTERARIDDVTGHFGIGATNPRARLHVLDSFLGVLDSGLAGDSVVIENGDAVLGLYSNAAGITGSAITLAEVSGFGTLNDKWTIGRNTELGSKKLFFSFGPNADYLQNTTVMTIRTTGHVGLGVTNPNRTLDIAGASAAARITNPTTAGAHLELKGTAAGLSFALGSVDFVDADNQRAGGVSYTRSLLGDRLILSAGQQDAVFVDQGGNVGIGTLVPKSPVHVEGGSDSEPAEGGFLTLGQTTGLNISIDNNEIMARDNGGTSSLFLNNDGGGVTVGGAFDVREDAVVQGTLDIGIESVEEFCTLTNKCIATCPPGKAVLTGGCSTHCSNCSALTVSSPWQFRVDMSAPPTAWYCEQAGGGENISTIAWVVCARIK